MGENGTGTVTQSGGECSVGGIMHLGLYPTATGTYTLTGGTLDASSICVGTEGTGLLEITGAQITGLDALTVRANMYADGELRGWGTIAGNAGSKLSNSGRIIADGGGVDRDLDLSGLSVVRNPIENIPPYNSASNGWFAVNGGRLMLPPVVMNNENTHVNWGETQYLGDVRTSDKNVDMINSVEINASTPINGPLEGALLASDHSAVPPGDVLPGGYTFISVWQFTQPGFPTARIKVRYDDTHDLVTGPADDTCPKTPDPAGLALLQWLPVDPQNLQGDWHWVIIGRAGAGTRRGQIEGYFDMQVISGYNTYLSVLQPYPGDAYVDGVVDVKDLLVVSNAWLTVAGDLDYNPAADFNADGAVNSIDLLTVANSWLWHMGVNCPESSSESTALLAGGQMAASSTEDPYLQRQQSWYEALDEVGLLDEWMDLITEHPEYAY